LPFIFKHENASEIFAEGEEIVSLAARNIEIVSNVAKTFVQTLDFSEINGFSLTYDEVEWECFLHNFREYYLSNSSRRCDCIHAEIRKRCRKSKFTKLMKGGMI